MEQFLTQRLSGASEQTSWLRTGVSAVAAGGPEVVLDGPCVEARQSRGQAALRPLKGGSLAPGHGG